MPGQLYKAAAIVGAAEANEIGFLEEPKSSLQLHIEAIKNVSKLTGMPISKIDVGCGEGTLHTFAVQHLTPPAWQDEAPYVTAYIDLKEGDRMLTVLRGVDPTKPEEIKIGARVKVEFEAASEDMHLPFWRVVEE